MGASLCLYQRHARPNRPQAFQLLQQRIERLRVGDGGVELTSSQVDEAAEIGDGLKEFYPKFKVIKSWPCRPALPSPAHVWPAHTGRASPLKPMASDLRR